MIDFSELLNINQLVDFLLLIARFVIPFLALVIILKIYLSLNRHQRKEEPLVVDSYSGQAFPVQSWENSIGRNKSNDVYIDDHSVSRDHCVLLRRKDGWFVNDTGSKYGTYINGQSIQDRTPVYIDDNITVGNTTLTLKKATDYTDISKFASFMNKFKSKKEIPPASIMSLITFFLSLLTVTSCLKGNSLSFVPLLFFVAFISISWCYFFFSKYIFKRKYFEIESLAIFLTGIGLILASGRLGNGENDDLIIRQLLTQVISFTAGIILFCVIIKFIEKPDKVEKWRVPVMIISILFLFSSIVLGSVINGATNWISIGGISIQPSEFVKIAFIFTGASALDILQKNKNLIQFILYASICVGALAIMSDFGTALIFFITFLMIAFMRSGSFKTVLLALSGAVLGGTVVLRFMPYIAERFSAWGHVFEQAYDLGYQQARTLTYCASGGLFGVGIGHGYLQYVAASETDLVFGVICEELGLIMALLVAISIGGLFFHARAVTTRSRSAFYSVSACCAAGLLVAQTSLNIFGATDILPLTGVTLPFISLGGSSMIACWGLLAFIKASDEKTYHKEIIIKD